MTRRRLLIILGILGFFAVLGLIAYFLTRVITPDTTDTTGSLPEIGTDFPATDPAASSTILEATVPIDNVHSYYILSTSSIVVVHTNGSVSKVVDGNVTALSSTPVPDFASASFSADGSKILVLTGGQPRTQVNIFDVATASWRVIPGTFRDAVWAPTGIRLATLTPDATTGKTAVGIYDVASGKTIQTVAVLALGDALISWPQASTIIVSDKPTTASTGSAWAIDVSTQKVRLAIRGGTGFAAQWSPTGEEALVFESTSLGRGGASYVFSGGVESGQLSFMTIPDKCHFFSLADTASSSIPYVLCAVPREQQKLTQVSLPDAWYRREIVTDDILVGINMTTRDVDFTVAPPLAVDATDIRVIGTTIYYRDRVSARLYRSDI